MAGLMAHLIVPFSSQAQKTAFTRWLDHNIVSSGNGNEVKLRDTIRKLPEQTSDFSILIQEASELVATHQDNFKIHLSERGTPANQPTTKRLIEQWNMFQNQKSGFNSVLIESVKSLSNWIPQNLDFSFFSSHSGFRKHTLQQNVFYHSANLLKGALKPLISGISINAP